MIFISFVYLTVKVAVLCSAAVLRNPEPTAVLAKVNLETLSHNTDLEINDAADFRDPPNVASCKNSHYNALSAVDFSGANGLPSSSKDASANTGSSASGNNVHLEKRDLEPYEKTINAEWFISDCPTQQHQQTAYTSLEFIWNPLIQHLAINRKFNVRAIMQEKMIYSQVEPGHPAIGFEGNFLGTFCVDFPTYKCTYGYAAHFVGNIDLHAISVGMYTSLQFGDFAPHVTETCIPVIRRGEFTQQVGPSITGPCTVQVHQTIT